MGAWWILTGAVSFGHILLPVFHHFPLSPLPAELSTMPSKGHLPLPPHKPQTVTNPCRVPLTGKGAGHAALLSFGHMQI